jgi:RHH-type transcriptional regulator, proline utilization regulon repressor / proline dehydrogenase / delta 1-pyrroline-5-carboxylate dehydrogenase
MTILTHAKVTISCPEKADIRAAQRQSESAYIRACLTGLASSEPFPFPSVGDVTALGTALIAAAKSDDRTETLVDSFMQRFSLSTEEGVVLMCLAEALLRVPDASTANALIEDKISGRDWRSDGSNSGSLLVDISAWGLSLGSATLALDQMGSKATPVGILKRLIRRSGEPVIRQAAVAAMKLLGQQFVMGETIDDAIKRSRDIAKDELCSFDMLGEAARTANDATRYYAAYEAAIARIGASAAAGDPYANHGISIKLSALHPRYEELQRGRVITELLPLLVTLVSKARALNVPVTIDAEESDRLELHLDMLAGLVDAGLADGWPGLGVVLQAYQKRAAAAVRWIYDLAQAHKVRLGVRLVKGAYWDSEIKKAQIQGLDHFPVLSEKANTDLAYLRCAQLLRGMQDHIYPAFATHNAMTIAAISCLFEGGGDYELQRLHGMGEGAHEALLKIQPPARPIRIYAPVGTHRDLLAYLVRRLLENGANNSFVHQFADPTISVAELAIDPRDLMTADVMDGDTGIAKGTELFLPERRNSKGADIADPGVAEEFLMDMAAARQALTASGSWDVGPIVVGAKTASGQGDMVLNPATGRQIGSVKAASGADIDRAASAARIAQPNWSLIGGTMRADILDRAADLIEGCMAMFLALATDESGKTLGDAIAEVREAVDFLRYYALGARRDFDRAMALPGPTGERNELVLEGRGVFVCISPWNFPLAIFLGQVAAALAAGNAVLAKPAEQTPIIAWHAVMALLEAGVPAEILAFLPGDGESVGAALVAHPDIAGVCFTGSTAVAKAINRTLANRDGAIIPLIAETGGINAMIVDSTALPEQVSRDAIASAFQSAGQRCSALRLLCVQDDVYDIMLEMLSGAMAELVLGDPAELTTDIGPIIDAEAQSAIATYVAEHRTAGRVLAEAALPSDPALAAYYVAPAIIAVDKVSDMMAEIFGPVLHVVRFPAGGLDALIDQINGLGYGLTLGVHSRIDAVAAHVATRAAVGNIYVNRNQIGAIVGSQPFGGRGLSGTGPKAGGPHYLFRFAEEKTISTDITASGGNADLMTR